MAEIDSAAQYIRVLFEGTEVCFRIGQSVTKDALLLIKNIMKMLKWLAYNAKYGREIGGTNIKNLILRDSNLIAARIPKDYINEFKTSSKKMGILYTRVPSKDSDTYTVLLHASSFPRVKQIIDTVNKKAENDEVSCRAEMVSMEDCVASLKPSVFDLNDSPVNKTDEITGDFVKKNSLDEVIDNITKDKHLSKEPIVIADSNNLNNYIIVSKGFEPYDERMYLKTEYVVFNDGKKQKCDEFNHGNFWHFSQASGDNSSELGSEHWDNVRREIKEKSGISGSVLLFKGTAEFEKYKKEQQNDPDTTPVLIPVEREQYISDENEKAVRINITGKTEEKNIWISKNDLNQLELTTDNIITIPIKRDKQYKVYDNENKFTGETIVAEDIEKYMSSRQDAPQHGIEKLEYQADRYSKWNELVLSENAEELIIHADSIVFEDDINLGFILESGQESMEVTIEKKYCFKDNDINISGDDHKIHAVLMKDKTYSGKMYTIGKPEEPLKDLAAKSIIDFKNSAEQKNTASDLSEILKKTESVTKDTILRNVNKQ